MSGRSVLITGAGGFVGGALTTGFVELGWDVVAVDRAFDATSAGERVRRVTAELGLGVPAEVPAVDVVVHAAWVTTTPEALGVTRADYVALNLRPLLAVLEYSARTRPVAFVLVSSSGVFSASDGGSGLTDTDPATGSSPYAAAKRAAELLAPAALDADTALHVARLGYLFGPNEAARGSRRRVSLVAEWLSAAHEGRPLAVRDDDPERDWTFTEDLAPAMARLVDGAPAGRPIHLGSPHVIADRDLAALVAELCGAELVAASAGPPVKPPMTPSDLAALRDFEWTDPATGLRILLGREAVV